MPSRELVSLGVCAQMATTKRKSQCSGGKSWRALSSSQTAQPPATLRAAEPLPRRARADNSCGVRRRPAAAQAATASAANPLALEASPAPVKAVLQMLGRGEDVLRLPMVPVSDATRRKLERMVGELGMLVGVPATGEDLRMF